MTQTDIKNNWNYFRSLTKQFQQTEQFVDHYIDSDGNMANGKHSQMNLQNYYYCQPQNLK